MSPSRGRRLAGEAHGTAFVLAAVVDSGTAERLGDGNVALALLADSFATGTVLVAWFSRSGVLRRALP